MQARYNKTTQGFTLIELLIVIAIIGLLATLAIVSLTTAQRKARDTKRVADIKQLQNAVELYYSEEAAYPDSSAALAVDSWAEFSALVGPYITNIPIDPENKLVGAVTYVYTYGNNDANSEYFIGAKLEDTAHAALSGDDNTNYVVGLEGWAALDVVDSNDVDGDAAVAAYDCNASATYCASE